MVDFSALTAVDLSDYHPLSAYPIEGTLGLITIENDIFLCVVSGSTRVATVRVGVPGNETVQRIHGIDFRLCPTVIVAIRLPVTEIKSRLSKQP